MKTPSKANKILHQVKCGIGFGNPHIVKPVSGQTNFF
jgi:hypothetical protein